MSIAATEVGDYKEPLSDDELGYIMCLAAGDSISAKFALTQVSRRWRMAAIRNCALWARFSVSTPLDASRLPTVVGRARGMLLDATLDFSRLTTIPGTRSSVVGLIDLGARIGIYNCLAPRLQRIRTLSINFGRSGNRVQSSEPLGLLLSLPIPEMEHLVMYWRTSRWDMDDGVYGVSPIVIPLTIPLGTPLRLRHVSLTNAIPADWGAILAPTIKHFHLDAVTHDRDLLRGVLSACPYLEYLTFLPSCLPTFEFAALNPPNLPLNPNLRTIHFGNPARNIWDIVSSVLPGGSTDDITVSLRYDPFMATPAGATSTLAQTVLHGLGQPVSCSFTQDKEPEDSSPCQRITIQDADGHVRRMDMTMDDDESEIPFASIWSHLALQKGTDTVRVATFSHSLWRPAVQAFARAAPLHPAFELRILFPRLATELQNASMDLSLCSALLCPTLAKVTVDTGDHEPNKKFGLVRAILDKVDRSQAPQATQICFGEGRYRRLWAVKLQPQLRRRPGWVLCEHCVNGP
ncbi:hypothetical protein AURDEDRAFT_186712 [Auricularia subglabra TFB-10046 SS5]|nr:hypothetical protein AURDEDRAFT_186712 [Auricularia subglabra TFB-10046 SS5]